MSQMKNLEYKWKSLTDINSGRENNLYQNKDHTRKFKFKEEHTRRHKRKKIRLSKQFRQGQCRLACAPMAGVPQCPLASSPVILNTDAVDLSSYRNYSSKTRKKPITIKSSLHRLSVFTPL